MKREWNKLNKDVYKNCVNIYYTGIYISVFNFVPAPSCRDKVVTILKL